MFFFRNEDMKSSRRSRFWVRNNCEQRCSDIPQWILQFCVFSTAEHRCSQLSCTFIQTQPGFFYFCFFSSGSLNTSRSELSDTSRSELYASGRFREIFAAIMSLEIVVDDPRVFTDGAVSGIVVLKTKRKIKAVGMKIVVLQHFKEDQSMEPCYYPKTLIGPKRCGSDDDNYQRFLDSNGKPKSFAKGSEIIPFTIKITSEELITAVQNNDKDTYYSIGCELRTVVPGERLIGFLNPFQKIWDYKPEARKWQKLEKSKPKYFGLGKSISIEVTVPTGVDLNENIPIHIAVSNMSHPQKLKIRCLLTFKSFLRWDSESSLVEIINGTVEEIEMGNGQHTTYFQIHAEHGSSLAGDDIIEKYGLSVDVALPNDSFLNVQFPIDLDSWDEKGLHREKTPFKEVSDCAKELLSEDGITPLKKRESQTNPRRAEMIEILEIRP